MGGERGPRGLAAGLRWFGLDGVEQAGGPLVDLDGDGQADDRLLDVDGDGLADRALGDGVAYVDTDGDGRWDVRLTDSDGDGRADASMTCRSRRPRAIQPWPLPHRRFRRANVTRCVTRATG